MSSPLIPRPHFAPFIFIILTFISLVISATLVTCGNTTSPYRGLSQCPYENDLVHAIYVTEGGAKARKPYGVLSVYTKDREHARQITIQSIRNNWARWQHAGAKGSFVSFMGKRWCPDDSALWARNVTKILKKNGVEP